MVEARRFLTSAIVLGFVLALSGVALAAGQVGDPPTLNLDRCDRFTKPCSDPLILGTGRAFNGQVELIGFESRIGFCFEVDTREHNGTSGIIGCGGTAVPSGGKPISFSTLGFEKSGGRYSTQLSGTVRGDVAGLRLRYARGGETKRAALIFNRVDGDLLNRVGEPAPFGVFQGSVHGCIPLQRLHVTAYDAAGDVLGMDRAPGFGGSSCPPPSTLPVIPARPGTRSFYRPHVSP